MDSILVLGDSIVNQIQDYGKSLQARYDVNLGLDKMKYKVHYRGISGGKITNFMDLKTSVPDLSAIRPKVVVLHVGSNDLCDLKGGDEPLVVGFKLADLVNLLIKQQPVKYVILSSIIPRIKAHRRMKMTLSKYNTMVSVVNNFLQGLFKNNRAIKFWRHRRLETSQICKFIRAKDGVHLTKQGHVKWVRGIRGRLLPCLKECF